MAAPARRLPLEVPLGLGGHPEPALRPGGGQPRLPPLHGPARVRGLAGLRRHRCERAPPERLRPDALAEPHRGGPRAADLAGRDLRDRQLDRALQPADPRGGRVRDARRDLGRAPRGRLPGRHADGHQLLLRADPGAHARQVLRGARPDHARVVRPRALRLRRQVQPAPLRELLAAPDPEAAPAHLHPGRRLDRDLGVVRAHGLQLLVPVLRRLHRRARPCSRASGTRSASSARTSRRTAPRSRRSSAWPRATQRPRSSTPSTASTSSTAACTSTSATPTRRATARSRRSRAASSTSSAPSSRRCSRTSPGRTWSRRAS